MAGRTDDMVIAENRLCGVGGERIERSLLWVSPRKERPKDIIRFKRMWLQLIRGECADVSE